MFKIVKITDKQGNDRTDGRYPLRIGRKCNIDFENLYISLPMSIEYAPDAGEDYRGILHTSNLIDYGYINNQFVAKTLNSIYYLETC